MNEIYGWYVLIAEGGGWPTHAIGPFETPEDAEIFIDADKWRQSWGGISTDVKDLRVIDPEDDRLILRQLDRGFWSTSK
mgnify:FL=1